MKIINKPKSTYKLLFKSYLIVLSGQLISVGIQLLCMEIDYKFQIYWYLSYTLIYIIMNYICYIKNLQYKLYIEDLENIREKLKQN